VKGRFVIDDHNYLLCGGDANVRVDATLAPSLNYGWQEVPLDSAAAAVGCRPIGTEEEPDTPYLQWDCVLPQHGISPTTDELLYREPYAGNEPPVRIKIPSGYSSAEREENVDLLQRVECVSSPSGGEGYSRGEEYECFLPERLFDNGDGTYRPWYWHSDRNFDRELVRPATARDFSLRTSVDDFYLDNACWFPLDPAGATAAWVKRVLQRALEFKLDKALEEESEVIGLLEELLVADAADLNLTSPHAINLTMRPCTTDSDCQDPYVTYEGGGRHQCSSAGFCDQFRIEPRRLNMRPEGLEFVLAEGPLDPQHSLLEGSTLFAGLGGFCDPIRYPQAPDAEGEMASETLDWRHSHEESSAPEDFGLGTAIRELHADLRGGLFAGASNLVPRSICSTDDHDPNNQCICADNGYQCSSVAIVFDSPGSYCVAGECCTNNCGDPDGCVDYQTDPENCGGCGDACAPGLGCVAGECCDVCPSQPWICRDTQSDPESCCGTNCIAFGGAGATCVNGQCVFP